MAACGQGSHPGVQELITACDGGDPAEIRRLLERNVYAANDVKNSRCFHQSCVNGRLGIAKMLASTFGLTPENAKDQLGTVFFGDVNPKIAKWFHNTFPTSPLDLDNQFTALRSACRQSDLEFAKWCVRNYDLASDKHDRARILHEMEYILLFVRFNDDEVVLKWLVETFKLTFGEIEGLGVMGWSFKSPKVTKCLQDLKLC